MTLLRTNFQDCRWCGVSKPEKDFRLIKRHIHSAPYLHDVCTKCETAPSKKCAYCRERVHGYNCFKESPRIYFCKNCYKRKHKMLDYLAQIKIEKKLIKLCNSYPMENNINGLRSQLFQTIEDLREGKITTEVAAQIADVARAIIDTQRVENEFIVAAGGMGSGFISVQEGKGELTNG